MKDSEKRRLIRKKTDFGLKLYCQGCGEKICEDDDLSDVEYVKTKRKSEIFFHTGCLPNIWRRKIM